MPRLRVITLPQRTQLLAKLASVRNDDAIAGFHAIILRSGGQRMTGEGVVVMLIEAIRIFTADDKVIRQLLDSLGDYTEALINDRQVRADARRAIERRKP